MNGKLMSAILAAAALVSCGSPAVKPEGPRPVKVTAAVSLDAINKSYSGVVAPDQFSDLAFKVSGPMISLNVEEGQKVRAGQVIAEIDPLDYQLDYEAKKSSYLTAKSSLERAEKLLAKQAISRQDYETTQAQFSNAKAAFENAENTLEETRLKAPFDGFIQKKYVENYQKVQAGQGIVCLINPDKLLVRFTLPETNMRDLTSNPNLSVEFDNYRGTFFKARIKEYIEASPDGSGVPVSLYIDDPRFNLRDYRVAVGFSCRVLINVEQSASTGHTLIPLSAIFTIPTEEGKNVFVYDPASSTISRRKVTEGGVVERDKVIVTDGLKAGETVVVAGTTRLVDGQQVKLLSE
ncbi:MAG: efflux RND transporter periplasmic adaptor subunit, partial [Rikenellaceae bacterium]|nr:efflux RND transporter periplasmic adaptor subunit [Rikenellaceae bacterium]